MAEPLTDKAWVADLDAMIEFASDGIVSKTVVDEPRTKVVLFAMETGQSLSEHTASMPASIHVLQGTASLLLGTERHDAPPGTWVYMPAHLNHAVDAVDNVVFLLTLFRGAE
jgi:quercetin dioxygenase-like cupin family protein